MTNQNDVLRSANIESRETTNDNQQCRLNQLVSEKEKQILEKQTFDSALATLIIFS